MQLLPVCQHLLCRLLFTRGRKATERGLAQAARAASVLALYRVDVQKWAQHMGAGPAVADCRAAAAVSRAAGAASLV
jgi:hypothetical protein